MARLNPADWSTLACALAATAALSGCAGPSPREALLARLRSEAAPASHAPAACARLWGETRATLCAPDDRGAASTRAAADDAWRRLSRAIAADVAAAPTPDALGAAALAQVVAVRAGAVTSSLAEHPLDDAVGLLERAVAAAPEPARWASDLAAVLWLRSATRRAGHGFDLLRALARLEGALESEPRLPAARWNRALVLEALHLERGAAAAWEDYLALGEPPEADQARARLAELRRRAGDGAPERLRARVRAAARDGDDAALRVLARDEAQALRELVEDVLLVEWAVARERRDAPAGAAALDAARRLALAPREAPGEGLAAQAVAAIDAAQVARQADLAAGHLAWRRAGEAVERTDWAAAARAYLDAAASLARGGSPFALAARVERAVSLRYDDVDASERELRALEAATRGFPTLEARRLWGLGLAHKVRGRPLPAYHALDRARRLYDRAGERPHAALLAGLVADVQHELGIDDLMWDGKRQAFSRLDWLARHPTRLHSTLVGSAGLARESPVLRAAARALFDEFDRCLPPASPSDVRASASLRRARLETEDLRWDAARRLVGQARALLRRPASAASPQLERLAADLDVSQAALLCGRPSRAVERLDAARRAYGRQGYGDEDGALLAQRARALRRLGRVSEAERDLDRAFAEIGLRLRDVRAEAPPRATLRVLREIGDELLDLRRASGAGAAATLAGIERWREVAARRLAGCAAEPAPAPSPPPGAAVLAYAVLPERVVGWSLRAGRARQFDAGRPEALHAAVSRLRDELSRGSDGWRATSSSLRAALVGPAEGDLRGAARVLVAADGFLRALPFAFLRDARGGRLLGDEFALAQGLAAASGLRGWDALRPLPPDPTALVVVGSGTEASDAPPGLPALAGAEAEGRALLGAYPRATLLAGRDARRETVLRAWPGADVVHVAAHGLEGPLDEGTLIVLGPGPEGGEVLRARDLRALRLPRAPVVVLGACHSAAVERGDGALVAALLGAGARAVIATLWAVRDAESAAFLTRLHGELRAGHDAPEALRRAQRASSPAAGAAFVAYVGPGACAR